MASELARLRSTLQDLQSVQLPANYQQLFEKENDPTHRNEDAAAGHPNLELIQRYKNARNAYLQQKTVGCFISALQKYDPATNTFPLPEIDPNAQVELAQRQSEVLKAIRETMDKVSGEMDLVHMTWKKFCDKREELSQIVEGIERDERNRRLQGEADGSEEQLMEEDEYVGEEITEDDVAHQEEKLERVQQRKLDLENRLRNVRSQILDLEDDCHRTKRIVNEVRAKGGRKPLVWKTGDVATDGNDGNIPGQDDVEHIPAATEQLDLEIAQLEQKATELKKSSDFYDGMRELMEELGGVKILSSTTISSPTENLSTPNNDNGFILTLMLLGNHILEITLTQSSSHKDGLHVSNAKITTATTFPMPESPNHGSNDEETTSLMETMHSISLSNQSFSKILSQKQAEEVAIPPLDDLVSWSHSLESSSHGIRFILLETMARIRALEARVVELSKLRERYAAYVYDVESSSALKNHRYGGAEQEVVCAINEGITVALRLGADCPLVPGSVYISEIFGLGGWDEGKLKTLKSVVLENRCRGPVEVLQCLRMEIRKRCREDGWVVPTTPTLPRGKR